MERDNQEISGSIIWNHKSARDQYATINTYILDKMPQLTGMAKYVWCYIKSRPPKWILQMKDMTSRVTDGEASHRSALKNLEKNNILHRIRLMDKTTGKIAKSVCAVFDTPVSREDAIKEFLQENPNFRLLKKEDDNIINFPVSDFPQVESPPEGFTQVENQHEVESALSIYKKEKSNSSLSYERDSVAKKNATHCQTSGETSQNFKRIMIEENNDASACVENLSCFRTSIGSVSKKENKPPVESDENFIENKEEPLLEINSACSVKKEKELIESSCQDLSSKKKTKNGTLRSDASEIIAHWKNKGFSLKEKYESTAMILLEKLMRSTLLSDEIGFEQYKGVKFTKEQVIMSIDKFHQAAFDNNYQPSSLTTKKKYQKIPLHTWIFNRFSKSKKSLFICFHEKPVHLIREHVFRAAADDFPELTKAIKNEYVRVILKGIKPIVPWDEVTENKFRQSAKNLNEFVKEQNGSLQSYARDALLSPDSAARILTNSILDSLNDKDDDWSKITPGWFSSSLTFNERLPKYLRKEFPVTNYHSSSSGLYNPFAAI